VYLAVRPERHARKLHKRFAQRTVLAAWLIAQAAKIERVRGRAKRWRNLGARLIEAAGDSSVIRRRLLCTASGEDDRRAHQDQSSHGVKLGLAVDHFKRGTTRASALGSTPRAVARSRRAPAGLGRVQLLSGIHRNVVADGTIETWEADAEPLLRVT
jgi:hypothetical protein